jgi:hypothetical protein
MNLNCCAWNGMLLLEYHYLCILSISCKVVLPVIYQTSQSKHFQSFSLHVFSLGTSLSEFWKFPISNRGYDKNVIFRMVSYAYCSTRNFYCVVTVRSVACHTVSKSLIKDYPLLEAGIKILNTWFFSTRDYVFNYYNQIPIACHSMNDKQREQRFEW